MERYNRNRIYVTDEEQSRIKNVRILLAGAGIGSIIAECALRFGFLIYLKNKMMVCPFFVLLRQCTT